MKSISVILIAIHLVVISNLQITKGKKSTSALDNLSDAELEKMMKDYGIEEKDMGILSKSDKSKYKLNEDENSLINGKYSDMKIGEIYKRNKEILKRFELSMKDITNLISQASNYKIFSRLPVSVMNVINSVYSNEAYQKGINVKPDDTNVLISNTLSSQVFVDHENKVGRKGMLSLLDIETGKVRNIWAVLNNKVLCLYSSKSYLNIIKIFRVSMIKIKDSIYSPCFFILIKEEKTLLCALNYREKDYWIKLINYHLLTYK